MTIEQMRSRISEVYDNRKWINRVDIMPDAQVIAIYKSMESRGVFEKKKPAKSNYRQMTIFDYYKEVL